MMARMMTTMISLMFGNANLYWHRIIVYVHTLPPHVFLWKLPDLVAAQVRFSFSMIRLKVHGSCFELSRYSAHDESA